MPLSPDAVPGSQPTQRGKPSRKPAPIFRLCREPANPARTQAANLLKILRETLPEATGRWLIVSDLSKSYSELAAQEEWPLLRWAAIGRELAKLTKRKTIKLHGKRHVAYLLK